VYKYDWTQNFDPGSTFYRPKTYTILSVTSFSISYNKTHKSGLKHEIKYDLHKI